MGTRGGVDTVPWRTVARHGDRPGCAINNSASIKYYLRLVSAPSQPPTLAYTRWCAPPLSRRHLSDSRDRVVLPPHTSQYTSRGHKVFRVITNDLFSLAVSTRTAPLVTNLLPIRSRPLCLNEPCRPPCVEPASPVPFVHPLHCAILQALTRPRTHSQLSAVVNTSSQSMLTAK